MINYINLFPKQTFTLINKRSTKLFDHLSARSVTSYVKKPEDSYDQFKKNSVHLKQSKNDGEEPNFGNLSVHKEQLESEYLEDDPDHMERMEVVTNKKPRNYYLFGIRDAVYNDKKIGVSKALKLYREMKLDRKLISADFYKMLIKGCGLVGYVDKAFELYDEYRELDTPTINTTIVTSMFNCCANSPDKKLGLRKAKEFYDDLRLSGYNFNIINYKILIKTFGLLGDLDTAFAFVDTLVDLRYRLDTEVFNNLLIGVSSNQANGLGIATNIIQAMRFLNIKPNIYTYNLLYRITRDCHFGTKQELIDQVKYFKYPDSITSEFLRSVLSKQRISLKNNYTKLLENQHRIERSKNHQSDLQNVTTTAPSIREENSVISLNFLGSNIDSIQNQVNIVDIDYESLSLPENRLKLIGGVDFLLNYMLKDDAKPDIKTISLLTSIIPNNKEEEIKLIKFLDQTKIRPDSDFYNMLIRKANLRGEHQLAKQYLKMMTAKRLAPNIQTYGVMAMSCFSHSEIKQFITEMDEYGVKPNVVIMCQLIRNSISKFNFIALGFLVNCLKKYRIKPTRKLSEYFVLAEELGMKYYRLYEEKNELRTNEKAIVLNETFLKYKRELNDYLSKYPNIDDENDLLKQFKTEELPKNEEYHRFKIQMTKALKEKKRWIREKYADANDED